MLTSTAKGGCGGAEINMFQGESRWWRHNSHPLAASFAFIPLMIGAISGRLARGSYLSSFLSTPLTNLDRRPTAARSTRRMPFRTSKASSTRCGGYLRILVFSSYSAMTAHCPARARRAGGVLTAAGPQQRLAALAPPDHLPFKAL